jgi:hypothetical protein
MPTDYLVRAEKLKFGQFFGEAIQSQALVRRRNQNSSNLGENDERVLA